MSIETATDAMGIILDQPNSVEAQNAVQHLLRLVVDRQDALAFNYLGTLLRQSMYPDLVAYARPYFIQALNRSESYATSLETALSNKRQMMYQLEKDFQHLQLLKHIHTISKTIQAQPDTSQETALSLQQSLLLLRGQVESHLKKIQSDYPSIFTKKDS